MKRYLLSHPRHINTTNKQKNFQNTQEKYLNQIKDCQKEYSTLCEIKKEYEESKLLREKRRDNNTQSEINGDRNKNRNKNKKNGIICDEENENEEELSDEESDKESEENEIEEIDGSQSFFTTQDTCFEADISNLTSLSSNTMIDSVSVSILNWNLNEEQEENANEKDSNKSTNNVSKSSNESLLLRNAPSRPQSQSNRSKVNMSPRKTYSRTISKH